MEGTTIFESWVVGVAFRASSNVARVMGQTLLSTNAANKSIARQNALLTEQIASTRRAAGMAITGFGALAAVSGAAIYVGVKGASDLQQAMVGVAIATKTTASHMNDLYSMSFKVSGMTAQNVTTIGQEMAMAATSGLNDRKKMLDAFPRIAKAADVMWLSPKHLDPVNAVKQMSTLSHLFGAYSGAPLQHMLDRATQMMFVQPEGLQQLVAQGRMFIGPALSRGITEDDIFKQAMTMGQTGFLRSRGGSGLARVIEYLGGAATMTGHLSKIQHAAMRSLGLTDSRGMLSSSYEDRKGNLLLGKAVDHLEKIRSSFTPVAFGNLLTNAFLAQGGRYMSTILIPSVYQKAQQNWQQMTTIGNVDSMWKKYSGTFWYQWSVFATNFQNISKAIFLPLLPQLTVLFKNWGQSLGQAVMYLSKHPKLAKGIGTGIFAVFAASIVGIGATSVIAATNVWRLNAALAALSATSGGAAVASGATKVGIIGRLGGFIASLFSGQLFRSIAMSIALRGGWMASVLEGVVGLGGRAIPVVGWIVAAASAFMGIMSLIRNAPLISAAIHNWWTKNQFAIGFAIGSAFATIGSLLQRAIMGLVSMAAATVNTLATDWYELALPGGIAMLQAQISAAQSAAGKTLNSGPGSLTFGSGLQSGLNSVLQPGGKQVHPHLEFHQPQFHFGGGIGPKQAKAHAHAFFETLQDIMGGSQNASNATGILHPVHPWSSAPAHQSP